MSAATLPFIVLISRVLSRALVLFVFIVLAILPGIAAVAWPFSWHDGLSLSAELLSNTMPFVLGLPCIFELYEHRASSRRPRLAAVATVACTSLFAVGCGLLSFPRVSTAMGLAGTVEAFRLHQVWQNILAASVALVFLMQRDLSRSAESQVRQHALQWRLARRRADEVASRTALMRLEPELLFETLRRSRSAFLVDPQRADASLEALTTYVRAVLQASKARQATFGDEAGLAVARLGLSDFAAVVGIEVDAKPHARARPVIAGVLPQLLYRWAEALVSAGSVKALIQVAASSEDLRLLVRFDAPSLPPDDVLEPQLQLLAAAAGKEAEDVVRFHGGGSFTLYFDGQL